MTQPKLVLIFHKGRFWQELRTYEEERQMPYITSVEQIDFYLILIRSLTLIAGSLNRGK